MLATVPSAVKDPAIFGRTDIEAAGAREKEAALTIAREVVRTAETLILRARFDPLEASSLQIDSFEAIALKTGDPKSAFGGRDERAGPAARGMPDRPIPRPVPAHDPMFGIFDIVEPPLMPERSFGIERSGIDELHDATLTTVTPLPSNPKRP
jgi:hypothetical protein